MGMTTPRRLVGVGAAALSLCVANAAAQTLAPSSVEFERYAGKHPDSLARKAGGLTERIEVQSTEDHIDYVVKAYVLQQANASEIFAIVQAAVDLEGGSVQRLAAGSAVNIGASGVTTSYQGRSYLVVTAPDWMIPFVDQLVNTLDVAGLEAVADGTGYTFYRPRHRRPSELAALVAASAASPNAFAVPDDSRNVLYLRDTPSYIAGVVESLNDFDVPPDQVEVHVRIFEIDETDAHDVGLDWYAWKKAVLGGDLSFVWGTPGQTNLNLESLTGSLTLSPQLATEFLNYLARDGRAKVITDTRLRVTNGETGVLDSTTDIPYVIRGFAGGVADSNHLDSPTAIGGDGQIKEFIEGVRVVLTPTIGDETMEMQIEASVASHVGYTPNQSVPIISSSSVSSVLDLTSGVPALLGGLTRHSNIDERVGIPGLMSVPGVRYLFSREVKRDHETRVFICVVPTRVNQHMPSDMMDEEMLPVWRSRSNEEGQ